MKINYIHTENIHNPVAASEVLPYLFNIIKPASVVDVGCGTGSWLKIAKQLGANQITGIDGVHVDTSMLCITEDEFLQHNLTLPLSTPKKYDLAICLEVAEHLPEEAANNIINILTGFSSIILFAAAIPGQGGQFHINEQWPDYWQKKFEKQGFFPVDNLRQIFWDNPKVDWWYRQNMLLYVKKDVLSKFNFNVATVLPAYVHPELLNLKLEMLKSGQQQIDYLEEIVDKEVNKPRFLPSFKKLIKSLIK